MKLVKINWVDSASSNGWQHLDDVDNTPINCTSAGFLVQESEESVTLALSFGENPPQVSNVMVIPRCSIKEIIEL